ncbi:MAG: ATP-binding protein [Kiritimatiellae bacterium]|jgi:predicted AAA+ superfamily ATPase|nr:ATP-binding protein [Kiritimatiellia bacterium]
MVKETLLGILKAQTLPPPAPHEVVRALMPDLTPVAGMAMVMTGVRRCGKSTLQAQLARQLGAAFYCNFEDTRLFEFSAADFPLWLGLLGELAPSPMPVFLDEVQEVEGWQRLVRTLLDHGRQVCLTGSNASLLGAELGRKLTGRHLSRTVFPFCYSEYLTYTRQKRGIASLEQFLNDGGFPMYLLSRRDEVLRELARDVVQRDVVSRHALREERHVMNLLLFLLANTGLPFSLQTLSKSLALPSVTRTSQYAAFLQDAYLLFTVPKYSASFKKRVVAPPKYYAIDNGLRRANSPQTTPDNGRRLENAIALEMLRLGMKPCYADERAAWECDFVTGDTVWQACWQLTDENLKREARGLLAAKALSRAKRMVVLTAHNQRQTLTRDGEKIEVIPAWEWLG